jgi:hypothetical protein
MSSFFDEVNDELVKAGPQAEPAPLPKPAPKSAVVVAPEPEIVAAPAPAPPVQRVRIEPEIVRHAPASAPPAAPEAMRLYDSVGVYRGVLLPDGTFEGVASATPATPFANLSEEDRRPVDWDEEQRLDLPQRSPGRIEFLLQYETEAQRKARIANDHGRALTGRGVVQRDPEKSAAAQAVQRWRQ